MIIHYSFFIFLLLFVPAIVFAEYSVPTEEQTLAETCNLYLDDLSEFPHSRNGICYAQEFCVPDEYFPWLTWDDEIIIMKNDYIVKQFLHKYPDASFEDSKGVFDHFRHFTSSWIISGHYNGSQLEVTFDKCGNITVYTYYLDQSEGNSVRTEYPFDDHDLEDIKTYEENKYNVLKAIIQRHPTPAIQVSEFNISLNEVHCNEGLELYIRDNNIPVCLKPHTYETLLDLGFNLHQPKYRPLME